MSLCKKVISSFCLLQPQIPPHYEFDSRHPGIIFFRSPLKQLVTSAGAHITSWWEEIGVEFNIPPGAVPEGKELELSVWPCSDGPFHLPEDYELASPVFLVSPSFDFSCEINLTMYHFSNLEMEEDCERMVFLSSPTTPNMKLADEKLAYQFRVLRNGVFKPHRNYGQISLTHFCNVGVGRRKRKKQSSTPNSPPRKQLRGKITIIMSSLLIFSPPAQMKTDMFTKCIEIKSLKIQQFSLHSLTTNDISL